MTVNQEFANYQAGLAEIHQCRQEIRKSLQEDVKQYSTETNIVHSLATTYDLTKRQQEIIQKQLKVEGLLEMRLISKKKEHNKLSEQNEKLEQELSKTEGEVNHSKKNFKIAIRTYFTNFGMEIQIKENFDNHLVAQVRFPANDGAKVNVSIDKKTGAVLGFDTSSLPGEIREKLEKEMQNATDKSDFLVKLRSILQNKPREILGN